MKTDQLLLLAAAAAALLLTSRRRPSQVLAPAGPAGPGSAPVGLPSSAGGDLNAYIADLGALAARELPALRQAWPRERVRQLVISTANTWGIPPELLWGAMLQESGAKPVGIFAGSVAKAQAARSSAFGMTQVTRTRYQSEAPLLGPPWSMLPHAALIDPVNAIGYMAASYNRGYKSKGGDRSKIPPWAGAWWAGGGLDGEGAQRKQAYILAHGAEVWTPVGQV